MKFQYRIHKNQPFVTSWPVLIPSTTHNPVPVIFVLITPPRLRLDLPRVRFTPLAFTLSHKHMEWLAQLTALYLITIIIT